MWLFMAGTCFGFGVFRPGYSVLCLAMAEICCTVVGHSMLGRCSMPGYIRLCPSYAVLNYLSNTPLRDRSLHSAYARPLFDL